MLCHEFGYLSVNEKGEDGEFDVSQTAAEPFYNTRCVTTLSHLPVKANLNLNKLLY